MKKKTRRRIFFGIVALCAFLVAGIAARFLLFPQNPAAIKVYFIKEGKPFAVDRPLHPKLSPLQSAMKGLLTGPKPEEGASSELPRGVKILGIKVRGQTAIIDFNHKLEDCGGGSARLQGMIAQIVYTATGVPGVKKAWILIEGKKEVVLGGEGLVLDRPLSRSDLGY